MHREQTIEDLRRNEGVVRDGKLNAHQQRFKAGDEQEYQRITDIHDPDLLVIYRCHPLMHHIEPPAPQLRSTRVLRSRLSKMGAEAQLAVLATAAPAGKQWMCALREADAKRRDNCKAID
jgi:hypothetical protein